MTKLSEMKGEVITSGHNHSWEVDEKGGFKLSLGNWSDAGWHWDRDQRDMVGFLIRLADSKEENEFLNGVKGKIDFSDIKPILLEDLNKNDGLYEISGDNRVWHFGESEMYEPDQSREFLKENFKLSDEKVEKIIDGAYDYFKRDYDEFAKQYGKKYKEEMKKIISESTSFEDFINKVKSEDFTMDWKENLMEYEQDKWQYAVDKSMEQSKKKLKKVI